MVDIYILSQLNKIIKEYENIGKSQSESDIYGLVDEDGTIFITSCLFCSDDLPHDPKLILPSSFMRLGKLFITNDFTSAKDYSSESDKIVMNYVKAEDVLHIFINDEDGWRESEYSLCQEVNIYEKFVIGRVFFSVEAKASYSPSRAQKVIDDIQEEITSSSFFQFRNSQMLFRSRTEDCLFGSDRKRDGSDKIETLLPKASKKKPLKSQLDYLSFDLLLNKSPRMNTAPVAQCTFNKIKMFHSLFSGEIVVYLAKSAVLSKIGFFLSSALARHFELIKIWLLHHINENIVLGSLKAYSVKHHLVGYFLNLIFPSALKEANFKEYRRNIHKSFMFPLNLPIVRRTNEYKWQNEMKPFVIINPHEALPKQDLSSESEIGIIHGKYAYHHYMQDNFNDNKWGCAYRSLQTLISWFRLQGYTDKSIPSHREIQQILVDIKDKSPEFIGSKQWIGSTEVGFVLENYLNISSKFIFVSTGEDLASKGRELLYHFISTGTPIMIGGGVLAHTILGVKWNSSTGDIKFLILDPHYTGGEDINAIVKGGWCGWKGSDFWNKTAYYNLCLPLKPVTF